MKFIDSKLSNELLEKCEKSHEYDQYVQALNGTREGLNSYFEV